MTSDAADVARGELRADNLMNFRLCLAWAITGQKCQGLTLPKGCIVDITGVSLILGTGYYPQCQANAEQSHKSINSIMP